jgi:hypothetical protein
MYPDCLKKLIKYTAFYNTALSVLILNRLILTKTYLQLHLEKLTLTLLISSTW